MLFQAEILRQKYLKLNSLIRELSTDKTNSISNLLDVEVCLTSQIHNLVNECELEIPYCYLDKAKRMTIRKIDNTFCFCEKIVFS